MTSRNPRPGPTTDPKTAVTFPSITATLRDGEGHIFSAVPASISSADIEPSRTSTGEEIVNIVVELDLAGGTTTTLRYRRVGSSEIRTLLEVAGATNWSRLAGRPVLALYDHTDGQELSLGSIVRGLTSFMDPGAALSLPPGTVIRSENSFAVTPSNG